MISSPSVLLLDPDADSAEMYGLGLQLAGLRPCIAGSAADARKVLRENRPAAVVANLGSAAPAAWGLIDGLRNDVSTRHLPVVVLTARSDSWMERRAAALGGVALLLKPCLPDRLADVVHQSLSLTIPRTI